MEKRAYSLAFHNGRLWVGTLNPYYGYASFYLFIYCSTKSPSATLDPFYLGVNTGAATPSPVTHTSHGTSRFITHPFNGLLYATVWCNGSQDIVTEERDALGVWTTRSSNGSQCCCSIWIWPYPVQ